MSSTSMKFVTPSQYTKSNSQHFIINTRAVEDFRNVHQALGPDDSVLDFGCGTGETTLALVQGELGSLGQPGEVVGVDISDSMVQHGQDTHHHPNLSFQQLDVTQADSFLADKRSSFSLVTSFSCLHWVPDVPAAVSVFNSVLRTGGRFLFVLASSHNSENPSKKAFDQMRVDPAWCEILRDTTWFHFLTVHQNTDWMKQGSGCITELDLADLMKDHGFRVDGSKTFPLKYRFTREFVMGFLKSVEKKAFPQLQGDVREKFFTEYMNRIKKLLDERKRDEDGLYEYVFDGVQIFGEKVKDC